MSSSEQTGVLGVQIGVGLAHALGRRGVLVAVGRHHRAHLRHRQRAQRGQPAHERQRRQRVERQRALGHVGGVVADALDVGGDADGRQDPAQVARQRPAQRQPHHVVAGVVLELVDGGIVLDHPPRGVVVAAADHVQRGLELGRGHLAHAQQFARQARALLFVAHPNLPVM